MEGSKDIYYDVQLLYTQKQIVDSLISYGFKSEDITVEIVEEVVDAIRDGIYSDEDLFLDNASADVANDHDVLPDE